MSQNFHPIPPGELGGAIAVNIFAILSTLGLLSVALRVVWLRIRRHLLLIAPQTQEYVFFNTQLGQYAVCLLIATTFSSASGIIGISWIVQRGITDGWVCRSQATLMQISTYSAGYFTVAIAIHTFNSLVLKMRQSVILCRSTMSIGWIIAILMGLMPFMMHLPDGHIYGAAGLTCSIPSSVYPKADFYFHVFPILISSFLSAVFYSLVFLVLRGTLKIRGGIKLTLNPNARWSGGGGGEIYHRFIARVARSMLWYSVAYISLLVPYSFVRLLDISGFHVPFEVTIFGFACWFSLGIVDVLLLYNTFRVLGPVFETSSAPEIRKSMESFYTVERLQKSEYLTPPAPSPIWQEKNNQYPNPGFPSSRLVQVRPGSMTGSKSFVLDLFPLHQDQSLATPIEDRTNLSSPSVSGSVTPTFDYNYIITPPSPSLSSRSDMGRRDRENFLILSPGLPASRQALPEPRQSPGIYDTSFSNNEHVVIRQQSMQTSVHQGSSRSRVSSWASDAVETSMLTTPSPHPYTVLPKASEGQERLSVAAFLFPDRLPLSVFPSLSSPISMYPRSPSMLSTTSSLALDASRLDHV